MDKKDKLILDMINFNEGNAKRIQHFIKVYELSRLIAKMEGMDEKSREILVAAAIVHDIGIKVSLDKYGKSNGKLQEIEGPPFAEEMLRKLGYEEEVIERVSYLVAHHHTYESIDGLDYQILVEADFLVNLCEKKSSKETILEIYKDIFLTESGKELCKRMFGI